MEYSDFEGFPAHLTNGGVNEKGVAVRDVWAETRTELWGLAMAAHASQVGLQKSGLARVVMQRASTAREGVEIGDLIAKYGDADCGRNSHLIADKDECSGCLGLAGASKLWAAERLKADEVRVLCPGYIEEFPADYERNDTAKKDYLGSPNLVSFAIEER